MGKNESDSSTTKSGIAEGSITITKPSEQKQNVSQINRNTEGTANALKNSFDPQKVQERQETAALFSELAFNAIHELSHKRSGKQDGEISTWTTEERAMAHTLVGLISSEIAGSGNPMSTLTAAGVNALVVTALTKDAKAKEYFEKHPDQLQWASAVLGAAVAKTTGGSAQSGASIAASGTKNNWGNVNPDDIVERLKENNFFENLCEVNNTQYDPEKQYDVLKQQLNSYVNAGTIDHIDLIMFGACGGAVLSGQVSKTYDIVTGEHYSSSGYGVGPSLSPGWGIGAELVLAQISSIDPDIKINKPGTRKDIISGLSEGVSAFYVLGGGVYTPKDPRFANKVFITTFGVGTPQVSAYEKSETESFEMKRIRKYDEYKDGSGAD